MKESHTELKDDGPAWPKGTGLGPGDHKPGQPPSSEAPGCLAPILYLSVCLSVSYLLFFSSMSRTLVGDAPLPSPPCSLPSLFVLENLVPASQMSGPTLYGWGLVAHAEEGLQRGHVASPADLTHAVTSTTCMPIPWEPNALPYRAQQDVCLVK